MLPPLLSIHLELNRLHKSINESIKTKNAKWMKYHGLFSTNDWLYDMKNVFGLFFFFFSLLFIYLECENCFVTNRFVQLHIQSYTEPTFTSSFTYQKRWKKMDFYVKTSFSASLTLKHNIHFWRKKSSEIRIWYFRAMIHNKKRGTKREKENKLKSNESY